MRTLPGERNARGRHGAGADVYLKPGDFHFDRAPKRIRTVLGSCVAITVWHPQRLHGGMCHYMLPDRGGRAREKPDGRYADDAVELFMRELAREGTRPSEYEVKLFGGGRMFEFRNQRLAEAMDIGQRNIEAGRKLLRERGFTVRSEHLAGNGHRNLIFDIANGHVWLRHVRELAAVPAANNDPDRQGGN